MAKGVPARASGASKSMGSTVKQNTRDVLNSEQAGDDAALLRPVSADMQQFIGRQLRAVFDDVARQPVPDRFLELMKQLDNKTGVR